MLQIDLLSVVGMLCVYSERIPTNQAGYCATADRTPYQCASKFDDQTNNSAAYRPQRLGEYVARTINTVDSVRRANKSERIKSIICKRGNLKKVRQLKAIWRDTCGCAFDVQTHKQLTQTVRSNTQLSAMSSVIRFDTSCIIQRCTVRLNGHLAVCLVKCFDCSVQLNTRVFRVLNLRPDRPQNFGEESFQDEPLEELRPVPAEMHTSTVKLRHSPCNLRVFHLQLALDTHRIQ